MALDSYLSDAWSISEELFSLRRLFHREPELGNREWKTAERIEGYLNDLGISVYRPLETAVVGILHGGHSGPTAALRADIDALPIAETTAVEYASVCPGIMHACGHDTHITAALGAARMLASHRDRLHGNILFLFQPDEEGDGGAERLIRAGVMKNVSFVFGAHVSPDLPLGHIGVRYGKFYAASDTFRVVVHGLSCHGAEREKGIDTISAASEMVQALLTLPDVQDREKSVISVGIIQGGTAGNIISDRTEFSGMLRTLGSENRSFMRQALTDTIESISSKHGTRTELSVHSSYPGIVNHDNMTAFVYKNACRLLGSDHVHVLEAPIMTTEDFGYYLTECPGCFYHFGAGCSLPLHNAGFLPDDRSIVTAAALHASVLESVLTCRDQYK